MDRQKSYNYTSYNNQRYQYHDPHSNYNDNNYQDDYSQYLDDPDKLTDIHQNQDYISSKEASSIEEYNGQNNTYETNVTDNQDYTYDNYSSYVDEDSQDTILQEDYFSGKDYLQNENVTENFDRNDNVKQNYKREKREYRQNREDTREEVSGEFIPPSGKTIDGKMAMLHPELERNAQLEDQERISCMICHKVYSTKGNLKTHLRVVHNCSESKVDELLPNSTTKPDKNLPENMRMVCPLCKNHYRSRGNLRVHLKGTHELTLDEARKYLPQNPNRMSSSTKPKEYCPICHKTYTNKMNVRIHIKKIHADFDYSTKEIKMLVDGELKPKHVYPNPIKKSKEKDRLVPGYTNTNSLNHSPSMSNSLSENNYSTDENVYFEEDSQQGIYPEMSHNDNADIAHYENSYDGYNNRTLETNYPKKTTKRKIRADEYSIDSYQPPQDQYQPYDMYSPNEDQTSLIIKSEYQDHYRPPSPYNSYDPTKNDPYSVHVQNNQTRPKNQIQVPARKMPKLEYSYEEETSGEYPHQASIPPPIPPRKPASMVNELYSDTKDQLYQEPNSTVNNKSRKSMIDSCISLHNNFVSTCNKNLS